MCACDSLHISVVIINYLIQEMMTASDGQPHVMLFVSVQ